MTNKAPSNPCIRCGKQRIVTKVSEEYVNGSLVTTTLTSCPDPECQQKLDEKFEKERQERERTLANKEHFQKEKKFNQQRAGSDLK